MSYYRGALRLLYSVGVFLEAGDSLRHDCVGARRSMVEADMADGCFDSTRNEKQMSDRRYGSTLERSSVEGSGQEKRLEKGVGVC